MSATSVTIEFDVYHDWDASPASGTQVCAVRAGMSVRETGVQKGIFVGNVFNDLAPSVTAPNSWVFPNSSSWNTYSGIINITSPPQDINEVLISLRTIPSTSMNIDGTSQTRVDNIKIYLDGGILVDPLLYKVTAYTTTDVWTDVTPDTDYIPRLPYGLGIDVADTDNLELAADDGSDPSWYDSANTGTSWNDNGSSDYRVIKRIGDTLFFGGVDTVAVSIDGGTTTETKNGNLDVIMDGGMNTIKQLLVYI